MSWRSSCTLTVSTAGQTIDHQHAHAITIDEVVADNGVSTGFHTRLVERPEGRRLFDTMFDVTGQDVAVLL
jgi:hypothetical protein